MFTITLFVLITLTSILTIKTDLVHKQIKNSHLLIIAAAGILIHISLFVTQKTMPKLLIVNLIISIIIALFLYIHQLWRAGDAKLFMLYSLLMPPTGYETTTPLPLPCLFLFVNSFICGLVLLTPELLKIFIYNYRNIFHELISRKTWVDISRSLLVTFGLSWIIFPILTKLGVSQYGFFSFLIIFFLLKLLFDKLRNFLKYPPIFIIAVTVGLLMRLLWNPESIVWQNLLHYLKILLLYSTLCLSLHNLTQYISDSKDRVPFAPMLALGCLLSYSPFLTWLIQIASRR